MINKAKSALRALSFLRRVYSNDEIFSLIKKDLAVSFQANPPKGPVLILSPHIDDEIIGCGGAIIKHKLNDDKITVIEFTDGSAGFPEDFKPTPAEKRKMAQIRESEANKVKELLAIDEITFLKFKDSKLASTTSLVNFLAQKLNDYKPATVYVPSFIDPNSDHFEAAKTFYLAAQKSKSNFGVMQYEVWSPILANFYLNIDSVVTDKKNAIEIFESQKRSRDYASAIIGLNLYRGCLYGKSKYAEAYLTSDLKTYLKLGSRVF